MTSPQELKAASPLTLSAATAADLMTPNPVSIGQNATVKEAAAFLTDRGFSAAPVMDEAGRPVGVLSRADIVVHHRQKADYVPVVPDYYEKTELATRSGEPLPGGFQVESVDQTRVRDIMTPSSSWSLRSPQRRVDCRRGLRDAAPAPGSTRHARSVQVRDAGRAAGPNPSAQEPPPPGRRSTRPSPGNGPSSTARQP